MSAHDRWLEQPYADRTIAEATQDAAHEAIQPYVSARAAQIRARLSSDAVDMLMGDWHSQMSREASGELYTLLRNGDLLPFAQKFDAALDSHCREIAEAQLLREYRDGTGLFLFEEAA